MPADVVDLLKYKKLHAKTDDSEHDYDISKPSYATAAVLFACATALCFVTAQNRLLRDQPFIQTITYPRREHENYFLL